MKAAQPFFVGWAGKIPKGLQVFLATVCIVMTVGFAGAAILVGASQADPEGGGFRFDIGPQALEGIVIGGAYPSLWITKGTDALPAGRVILLNGNGKTGVQDRTGDHAGRAVAVRGVLMERGSLTMLQLGGGEEGLSPLPDAAALDLPPVQALGRWRISGEICDGRCAAGAMRPGTGLAHKACANLCIAGGQPPVFVSAQPVEGESFFLMTGPEGEALSPAILAHTADPVTVEGTLTRIGNLSVLAVDPASVRRQ